MDKFTYYNLNGKRISFKEFVEYYSNLYWFFSSEKEEEEIICILNRGLGGIINKDDGIKNIYKILKWKTGINKIEKTQDGLMLKTRRKINITKLHEIITEINKYNQRKNIAKDVDAKYFYETVKSNHKGMDGIGSVYAITLLFFASKGQYPIYDRYVHKALCAIKDGNRPLQDKITEKYVSCWSSYEKYIDALEEITEDGKLINFRGPKNYNRKLDRALWVYGQTFEDGMEFFLKV